MKRNAGMRSDAFLAGAKSSEILGGFGNDVVEKLDDNPAFELIGNGNIKVASLSRHFSLVSFSCSCSCSWRVTLPPIGSSFKQKEEEPCEVVWCDWCPLYSYNKPSGLSCVWWLNVPGSGYARVYNENYGEIFSFRQCCTSELQDL